MPTGLFILLQKEALLFSVWGRDSSPWVFPISAHLLSRGADIFCAELTYQGYLYSKQPEKIECLSLERGAGLFAVQYKIQRFPGSGFLNCEVNHLGHATSPSRELGVKQSQWKQKIRVMASFVSEPGVLWVSSASMKLQQSNLDISLEVEESLRPSTIHNKCYF